jgi:hypothetical protein
MARWNVRLFRREPFTTWRAVTDVLTSEEDVRVDTGALYGPHALPRKGTHGHFGTGHQKGSRGSPTSVSTVRRSVRRP